MVGLRQHSLRAALLGAGLAVGLAIALPACDEEDSAIGAPCYTESDCPESLICDFHQGKGSCQQGHLHGDTDGGETEGETDGQTDS